VRRIGSLIGTGSLTLAATGVAVAFCACARAAVAGLVRVDQVGYLPGDGKLACLMTSSAVKNVSFKVLDSCGYTVRSGSVATSSRGSWNTEYPDVADRRASAGHHRQRRPRARPAEAFGAGAEHH
jgi:hypothetical protein